MANVKIGHAASTEKGLIISTWYNKPWSFILRAKDPEVRRKMANACRAIIACGYVSYSQAGDKRNTLFSELKKVGFDVARLKTKCYCDCSSFMCVCAYMAGVPIHLDGVNAPSTNTMRAKFMDTGMFVIHTENDYTHGCDYDMEGDILDVPKSHTVMVLTNGSKVVPEITYKIGEVYTLATNLKVRKSAKITDTNQKKYSELTADGQKNAKKQEMAVFKTGTRVTCKDVKKDGNYTWFKCPSGWLCAVEGNSVYIK